MAESTRILVIGATGLLGRPVTRQLVREGFDVRALVRDARRAASVLPEACTLVTGDLRDRARLALALHDVDAVYLSLSNRMSMRRPDWDPDADGTRLVLDAIRANGRPHLLRLSAMGIENDPWWVAQAKVEIDEVIAGAGVPYTIFRPTWFMESIPISAVGPVLVRPPGPDDPIHWIAGDDFGRQVAAAVRTPAARDRVFEVQGPEPVSMRDAFRRFARVWRSSLVVAPLPNAVLRLGSRVVPPMHYLAALPRMTFPGVTDVPADVEAHTLARPEITIERFARDLLARNEFPSKRLFGGA